MGPHSLPRSLATAGQLKPEEFQILAAERQVPLDDIRRLLSGALAGLLVRDAVSAEECTKMVQRFWASKGLRKRGDGVEGYSVGSFHYGKTFDDYHSQTIASQQHVAALLGDIDNPVDQVLKSVRASVEPYGVTVRQAQWRGQTAALARALSWTSEEEFLLAPHDDVGQLTQPAQADFEIQAVAGQAVLAVNFYANVPKPGGNLRLWNVLPDDRCRRALGIAQTGYPYPVEHLEGIPLLDIEVETGSILILNGGLVHAVLGYGNDPPAAEHRLLVNFFLGHVDPLTIVHWV